VPWLKALRFHLPGMLLAAAWGGVLLYFTPGFTAWLAPVLLPLLIAPAITVLTSRTDAGRWLRRHRLQLIPEEDNAPRELRRVSAISATTGAAAGLAEAVVDPGVNALHVGLQGMPRRLAPELEQIRTELAEQVFTEGPQALPAAQGRQLLADPMQMLRLHARVWCEQPLAWQPWLAAVEDGGKH